MNEEFLRQTMSFLEKSDIQFYYPEFRKIEFQGDKKLLKLEVEEVFSRVTVDENFIISNVILFTLFDAFIESKDSDLCNLTFKTKYEKLNSDEDIDIIIKEIYRVLKLIRNTVVHNSVNIKKSDCDFNFSYTFKSTNFNLDLSKNMLNLLYSMINIIVKNNIVGGTKDIIYRNNNFYIGMLRSYYDEFKDYVDSSGNLNDDISIKHPKLLEISNGIRLKKSTRYLVENPKFKKSGNKIIIEKYLPEGEEHSSSDYNISLNEINYSIPNEVLNDKGEIKLEDLDNWKIE